MRVRGVLTRQGRDISDLLNDTAGDYADSYTGVLIAESGLNEQALREGKWPDYSAGLSQVIAANLKYGSYAQRPTDAVLKAYREHMFDPATAIKEGWRFYSAALKKHTDPLWAALAYNVGNSRSTEQLIQLVADSPEHARRLEHYRRALQSAERYRTMAAIVGKGIAAKMAEAEDEAITNEWTETSGGAKVAKAWGNKGLYVASDDGGGWVAAGPFGVEG